MISDGQSSISEPRGLARTTLVERVLDRICPDIRVGSLVVTMPSGMTVTRRGAAPGPEAVVEVRRWRGLWRMIRGGGLGFAEAYMGGELITPSLDAVFQFALANDDPAESGSLPQRLSRMVDRFAHRWNANTKRGSRRNISAHYDLGNAFYERWLDAGMSYSSAWYDHPGQTLEAAQERKLDQIGEMLELSGGERVLEIGCGWGGLAERLIRGHGCRLTGLTLSSEQHAYATARLAGLGGADIRLQDYRDVGGRFDRIVSIEMLEAVGERYWPTYFAKLRACLADGGNAVLQVITIAEDRFEVYRRNPDFIQRYIFPGGMLPTKAILAEEAGRAGFVIAEQRPFGASYAETLREWRRRFLVAWPEIEAQGFNERFKRAWVYYLAYCEAGFRTGALDVSLLKLVRS